MPVFSEMRSSLGWCWEEGANGSEFSVEARGLRDMLTITCRRQFHYLDLQFRREDQMFGLRQDKCEMCVRPLNGVVK